MDDNAENIKADGIKQAAQNAAKKAAQKKRSKLIAKIIIAAIKPLIIMALIVVIATIVLSSIHHFLDLFDGTMQEDDWSNVPYVKETSVSGIEIDTAGNIMTGMTAEEMWNLLLENESRIDEYLDKPEELKKLINAELATQFLDTRPDPNAPIDWDEINSDPTLNYTQGLIKLKRALNSGETITMVYTDPATFQGYVNGYNENKSEENKKNALQYFTLETEAVLLNGGTNGIDNKNDTNNSLNESVGSGKNQSFEEAYVNDSIDSATGETDDTTEGGMGSGLMFWPTDGTNVSSKFGPRKQPKPGASTNHGGIDIGIRSNTNIYATEKGKVIMAKDNGSAGIEVRLDHGNGYISRYLHLNKPLVSVGQIVDKGQLIALSGNTGVSTGPHLHFEIQYNGKKINPLTFKYHNGMGGDTSGFGNNINGEATPSNLNGATIVNKYYAKIATWNEEKDTLESDDPDVETYDDGKQYLTVTSIDYQNLVSGYTMPFEFLWDFLIVGQEKEFVLELSDLVFDSEIEITVHDNLTIDTTVINETYTKIEKITTYPDDDTEDKEPVVEEISHDYYKKNTIVIKSTIIDASVTKANTWIVDYTRGYTHGTLKTADITEKLADTPNFDSPNEIEITVLPKLEDFDKMKKIRYANLYTGVSTLIGKAKSERSYSIVNQNTDIENTIEQIKYIASPPIIREKTDPNSKEPNFVTIYLKKENSRNASNIHSAPKWLFEMLDKNRSTANMVDLVKYLLYKATGTDYGVTEFNFGIFDSSKFKPIADEFYSGTKIEGIPGQIYYFFLKKGISPVGAAAILGNIEVTIGFDIKDWGNVETRLENMWNGLEHGYASVKDVIMSAKDKSDLEYATWYWGRYFDEFFIGNDFEETKFNTEERYANAQKWYEEYQKNHGIDGTVYYQTDYPHIRYGKKENGSPNSLAGGGCGPTSFAMVASDYLGYPVTPPEAIAWCGDKYYVKGEGTSAQYFYAATEYFNLPATCEVVYGGINGVVEELKKGNLVISCQTKGLFTQGGHYILLSSVDSNGGIRVRDPNRANAVNRGYNKRVFSKGEIAQSATNYWVFRRY